MKLTRRQFLQASAASALGALLHPRRATASGTGSTAASVATKNIFVVTWRGRTNAEIGFVDYWREQGERNGMNANFIYRDAGQNRATLADIANEAVRARPDLIYTWGTPPTVGLAGTVDAPHDIIGRKIPLVFSSVADPVAAKIVTSLGATESAAGRNITGVTHVAPLLAQWNAMRTYHPTKVVGILYNRLEPNAAANVEEWRRLASLSGFRIVAEAFNVHNGVPTNDGVDLIVKRIRAAGADWLYLGPDSYLFTQINTVATLATAAGLRTFAATESHLNAKAPVLAGLVSTFYQVGQFAAAKSIQRLRGERAIPIEALKRFSLIVRLDTARTLGAYPPLAMIDYAEFRDG